MASEHSPTREYIGWLEERSMLHAAARDRRPLLRPGRPMAPPLRRDAPACCGHARLGLVHRLPGRHHFQAGESVLATLGDQALWQAFAEIGIQGIHTGPMKRAGGVTGYDFTPTIDGHFDRIGLEIDPQFGTVEEYAAMSRHAAARGAMVIDDIVPAHTGKGADFRLAELAYADYPGIYHMVEIAPADWPAAAACQMGATRSISPRKPSPTSRPRATSSASSPASSSTSRASRRPIGAPPRRFSGVDGVARRWVYLHYFKEGQPTLNWLDPSFAAPRLVIGDALHSLSVLGAGMLRLDANGFLGVEPHPGGPAWSEGHPLSLPPTS